MLVDSAKKKLASLANDLYGANYKEELENYRKEDEDYQQKVKAAREAFSRAGGEVKTAAAEQRANPQPNESKIQPLRQ